MAMHNEPMLKIYSENNIDVCMTVYHMLQGSAYTKK